MDDAFETPPKKPRVEDSPPQETAAGDSGSDDENEQHDAEEEEEEEEEENAEDEGGGLTPPSSIVLHTDVTVVLTPASLLMRGEQQPPVMVVSGGTCVIAYRNDGRWQHTDVMVAERKTKSAQPEWYVLKTKTIEDSNWQQRRLGLKTKTGGKVMWHVKCTSPEAWRLGDAYRNAEWSPLSWKTNTFFKNFRDAVVAQEKRHRDELEMGMLTGTQSQRDEFAYRNSKRARRRLVKITMGEHTMVVENTTKQCYIEATCANVDFVIKQLKSAE